MARSRNERIGRFHYDRHRKRIATNERDLSKLAHATTLGVSRQR